jgi:hypothetical protein
MDWPFIIKRNVAHKIANQQLYAFIKEPYFHRVQNRNFCDTFLNCPNNNKVIVAPTFNKASKDKPTELNGQRL